MLRRIGLVLGAGGVAGQAYHAGVLAALEDELGWDAREADVVVGSSAGSIVGALLRAGQSARDLATHLRGDPVSPEGDAPLDVAGPVPTPPAPSWGLGAPHLGVRDLVALVLSRHELTGGKVVTCALPRGQCDIVEHTDWLDGLIGDSWPSSPLWVCAVELPSLRRVVWGRDADVPPSVGTAVAASCAIPGYIAPIEHDGREFVDGGCHSPTNADVLLDDPVGSPPQLVVISSPMSAKRGVGPRVDLPLRRFWHRRLHRETAQLRAAGSTVVTIEPGDEVLQVVETTMDPACAPVVVDAARTQVRRQLAEAAPHLEALREALTPPEEAA